MDPLPDVPTKLRRRALPASSRPIGLAFVLTSCLGLAGNARAEPHHGLAVGLDLGLQSVRDDTLAPVAFSGPQLLFVPRYFGQLGNGLLTGEARLGLGYVLDRADAEGATFAWGLRASYSFLVREGDWNVTVGPALGWSNDLFYLVDWDDGHGYWIGTVWLGPGARVWHWLMGLWRMDVGGEIALLGWQSRTPPGRRRKQEMGPDVLHSILQPPTRDLELGSLLDWQVAHVFLDFHRTYARSRVPNGWGVGGELAVSRAGSPELAFAFNASLRFSYTWGLP